MAPHPLDQPATVLCELNDSQENNNADEEHPRDGGYGWVCVAACFTNNSVTWGAVTVSQCILSSKNLQVVRTQSDNLILQAYGIDLSHYLADNIFPEATTWDYAFIGGFNFAIAMLIAPVVTILTRKFGTHIVMLTGMILQCAGFISASFASRIWQLHISQGVLIGMGIGCLYISARLILSQWFVQRRSLANGISAAGSGVGGAAFTWGTEAIIQRWGISWALRITGIIALVCQFVAICVIRDRNSAIKLS